MSIIFGSPPMEMRPANDLLQVLQPHVCSVTGFPSLIFPITREAIWPTVLTARRRPL